MHLIRGYTSIYKQKRPMVQYQQSCMALQPKYIICQDNRTSVSSSRSTYKHNMSNRQIIHHETFLAIKEHDYEQEKQF